MSVETDTNQKENGERRRRLRLGSEDVHYILLCVQNLENALIALTALIRQIKIKICLKMAIN